MLKEERSAERARKECAVTNQDEGKELLHAVLPNVAAQMRAPLSILHANIQKVARDDPERAAQLSHSYYQLLRLAGNLSAAELMSGKAYITDLRNSDVVALCKKLVDRIEPLARAQGIGVQFECDLDYCIIACEESMIERLVLNLFSNALKFAPGGTVTLSIHAQRQDLLIAVSDTGCGIPEDKMHILFDRYLHSEQMDPTPHGLGLGLPICYAIAKLHGGRIFVESQVGKGTRVTLALPNEESMMQTMHTPEFDYAGGFDHVMVELSDALPAQVYVPKKKH